MYAVTGDNIILSGFHPERQIVGGAIQLSGENLNMVNSIQLLPTLAPGATQQSGKGGHPQQRPVDVSFLYSGTSGIWAYVPTAFPKGWGKLIIEGKPQGSVGVLSQGATPEARLSGAIKDSIEVVLDTTTVKYDIIETGNAAPSDTSRSMNYTIEENIGGTVFLVTRTKFPDGTTAVISSVPKP
jgi:hypothetical protein